MSSLWPLGSCPPPNFLENSNTQSLSLPCQDPEQDPLFAYLDTLDAADDSHLPSFEEGFKKLNQLTENAIIKRNHEASLEGKIAYTCVPNDENIHTYSCILPLRYNLAAYSEGCISGSIMPGGSVAMSGVTEKNVSHVAQFLFEHKVPIVVRLTAHYEINKFKSLDWIQDGAIWGNITCHVEKISPILIINSNANIDASIQKTFFKLTKEGESHHLIELYLENWPDGQVVPPKTVLAIAETLRGEFNALANKNVTIPFVTHCSGGIGRTGVFLTVLRIIEELKASKDPDIPNIILENRLARHFLFVMNAEQFRLCYACKYHYREQLKREGNHRWAIKV